MSAFFSPLFLQKQTLLRQKAPQVRGLRGVFFPFSAPFLRMRLLPSISVTLLSRIIKASFPGPVRAL